MAKYNKAIAAAGAAVVALLSLFGVDASDTVDTLAKVFVLVTPLVVAAWPKNAE